MIVIFIGTHSQVNIVLDGTASTAVDNGSKATRKQLQRTARGRVTGTTVQQVARPRAGRPRAACRAVAVAKGRKAKGFKAKGLIDCLVQHQ